jgi:hypothetical protein
VRKDASLIFAQAASSTKSGSVASFHLRELPLCFSPDGEVEEERNDQLQGEPIRAGDPFVGVRWYVAYPISYRQLEEMMGEWGVTMDLSTLNRWVIKYVPEIEKQFRRRQRPVGKSWRLDESVPRTHSQSAGMRCYTGDEGRSLGAGVQAQASNRLKLRR